MTQRSKKAPALPSGATTLRLFIAGIDATHRKASDLKLRGLVGEIDKAVTDGILEGIYRSNNLEDKFRVDDSGNVVTKKDDTSGAKVQAFVSDYLILDEQAFFDWYSKRTPSKKSSSEDFSIAALIALAEKGDMDTLARAKPSKSATDTSNLDALAKKNKNFRDAYQKAKGYAADKDFDKAIKAVKDVLNVSGRGGMRDPYRSALSGYLRSLESDKDAAENADE